MPVQNSDICPELNVGTYTSTCASIIMPSRSVHMIICIRPLLHGGNVFNVSLRPCCCLGLRPSAGRRCCRCLLPLYRNQLLENLSRQSVCACVFILHALWSCSEHRENALDGRGRWLSQHDSQRCRVPGGQPLKAGGVPQSLNVTPPPWGLR